MAKTVQDALREAGASKEFAVAFLKDPARYKAAYSLSDRDIQLIRDAIPERLRSEFDIDYE